MSILIDKDEAIKALEAIDSKEPEEIRVIGHWIEVHTESTQFVINLNNVTAVFKNKNKKDKWRTGIYVKYPNGTGVSALEIQLLEEYEDVLDAIRRAKE